VRIEKLKQTFEIDATLVHFPLHPETPAEGRSMAEVYAGRNVDPEAMYTRMKRLMDEEGLPYGRRTHTYNSRLAQELGKWADTKPGGEALHDALYKAYFVDARNIGDTEILVELARADVCGRPLWRGRCPALRGARATARQGRRQAARVVPRAGAPMGGSRSGCG